MNRNKHANFINNSKTQYKKLDFHIINVRVIAGYTRMNRFVMFPCKNNEKHSRKDIMGVDGVRV